MADSERDKYQNKIQDLENQISDNAKNLAKLRQEQLFSKKVLDSLPGIFYLYNDKGDLIRWNKAHETISGYSSKELPLMDIYDWFSASDKKKVRYSVENLFQRGEKSDVEADLIIKDGSAIPHYFTGVRMTINNQRYLLGVGTDITKLKEAEHLLKKSEEKYRAIVENAVEGIYQSTIEGKIVSANVSMARILGYDSPQDFIDSVYSLAENVYVDRDERNRFIRLIQENQAVSGFEVEFYKKNKSIIWISLHARAIFDSKGKLAFIEGMILDITEKKKQRDALQNREALLREENIKLKRNIKDRYRFAGIIGKSSGMQDVYDVILKASSTEANVIIYGESGTGKEIVARAIHNLSDRKGGPFVPVNCGAIPENLLESEFFGYKKGAFTGATTDKKGFFDMAHGGTLFLDELGEITLNLQVKLLRVIEGSGYRPVGGKGVIKPDVRIIAATNRNLEHHVAKGLIREDFFYRIHIIPINLPPLRHRKEDIPLLIDHFLKEMAKGDEIPMLSGDMMESFFSHSWPGNVRELQNVLQRYVTMGSFSLLGVTNQKANVLKKANLPPAIQEGDNYSAMMDTYERHLLVNTLENCQWNRRKAASKLNIPIRTFHRKLKKHGLKRQ